MENIGVEYLVEKIHMAENTAGSMIRVKEPWEKKKTVVKKIGLKKVIGKCRWNKTVGRKQAKIKSSQPSQN